MTQIIYHIYKIFCHHQKKFLLKNTFKVTLQYLFNVLILFNTDFYIGIKLKHTFKVASQYLVNVVILLSIVFNVKLSFKLKIDLKTYTFKNLEEVTLKNVATLL